MQLYTRLIQERKIFPAPSLNIANKSIIQSVPLATEPGISLIILTPMKILQRNLNSTFVVWEMKKNVSVVCVCVCVCVVRLIISVRIIKEMPGSVVSGTPCIIIVHWTGICGTRVTTSWETPDALFYALVVFL